MPLIDGGTVRLPRIVGLGRALDMILTGRPVGAREALEMGLANRVVRRGPRAARRLKNWRWRSPHSRKSACGPTGGSAYRQWELPLAEALRFEGRGGAPIVAREGKAGALRFERGAGRHGRFGD